MMVKDPHIENNRAYEYHNESKQIMIFLYASIVNKHLQDSKFRHFYTHATCHTLRIPKYLAIENKSKEGSLSTQSIVRTVTGKRCRRSSNNSNGSNEKKKKIQWVQSSSPRFEWHGN